MSARANICLNGGLTKIGSLLFSLLLNSALASSAFAQTVNTFNVTDTAPGGAITDLSCNAATSSQIVRTFTVGSNFIVGDVDLGVFVTHTYRSDVRIFLTSPAGTVVNVMTWSGNVQSGDNLNDLFDDEAAASITTHNATVTDQTTAPFYSHSFIPSNPLSAFDGQNAQGTWTLRICDAVGSDVGNFRRADLYLTSTSLSVTKASAVISDPINSTANPKAVPGATIQYCLLATNNGKSSAPNATVPSTGVTFSDTIPSQLTYIAGTALTGPTCATAASTTGVTVTGSNVTGSTSSLGPGETFAIVFRVLVN